MQLARNNHSKNKGVFQLSQKIIWFSSLFIAVLASVPKILQISFTISETIVDACVTFSYSVAVWYFNLYKLPKYSVLPHTTYSFWKRLLMSNLFGILIMLLLAGINQFVFPKYSLIMMIMMYQFRGVLINLTVFMFVHFLYQSYHNQQISLRYERLQADNQNAQYELLRKQVNPHFLFNSLNTLKAMIDINDPDAAGFVSNLSNFYRSSLENRHNDLSALSEELDLLRSFIFLLKSRFEEGVQVQIDLNGFEDTYVPPFTLQLLVENCIKHNVVSLESPLHVHLYQGEGFIVIKNNKQPKNILEQSSGIGLANIRGRYSFVSPKEIVVVNTATEFMIKLPLLYENPDH
jgi:two-component system LytT family sensor kinase